MGCFLIHVERRDSGWVSFSVGTADFVGSLNIGIGSSGGVCMRNDLSFVFSIAYFLFALNI